MQDVDADLIPAEVVVSLMCLRTTSAVRTLVSRGELAVAGRGAHNRSFFRRQDVLDLMARRASGYLRQRSLKGANNGERKVAGRAEDARSGSEVPRQRALPHPRYDSRSPEWKEEGTRTDRGGFGRESGGGDSRGDGAEAPRIRRLTRVERAEASSTGQDEGGGFSAFVARRGLGPGVAGQGDREEAARWIASRHPEHQGSVRERRRADHRAVDR